MKKFIIISGPMGVGKTTVGKMLCDTLGQAAFIDGDWCLDIHPFIGNNETKTMAVDNILHMTRNYFDCSECNSIVLSWVMSETTINKIIAEINSLNFQSYIFTLICNESELIDRWKKDKNTEWRNNEELANSLKSIDNYKNRTSSFIIDTSNIPVDIVVEKIIETMVDNK